MTLKYLFFGQFLQKKGLITFEDIFKARMLQKKYNLKIGDYAKEKGWLTDEAIERILVIQEESLDKFGEIAVREGYLTKKQIEELIGHQKEEYIFFGEALVRLGLLSEEKMVENLKEFNKLKFNSHNPAKPTPADKPEPKWFSPQRHKGVEGAKDKQEDHK